MDTITFANGETYNCTFCATMPNDSLAIIALGEVGFVEAAQIFSDPSMTERMTYGQTDLVGYTTLQGLTMQPYGVQASLRGGHDEPTATKSADSSLENA